MNWIWQWLDKWEFVCGLTCKHGLVGCERAHRVDADMVR